MLLAIFVLIPADQANAAFPGTNGKIAFSGQQGGIGNHEIYVTNVGGSETVQVTHMLSDFDFHPSWSPDGTKILFVKRWYEGTDTTKVKSDIFTVKPDGTDLQQLTNDGSFKDEPVWSPDGTKIVFMGSIDAGDDTDSEIHVMNSDGSGQTILTNSDQLDESPAWSPNGQDILFLSNRGDGIRRLYRMNSDGSNVLPLANIPNIDAFLPGFKHFDSVSGSNIAFIQSFENSVFNPTDIYTMHSDGSSQINLTNDPVYNNEDPEWSPDGSKILYLRQLFPAGFTELVVINADGTSLVNFSTALFGSYNFDASWSPDGKKILLTLGDALYIFDITLGGLIEVTNDVATYFPGGADWQPILSQTGTATLTVIKQVVNNSGGVAVPSDFSFQVSGSTTTQPIVQFNENGQNVLTFPAGTYSVYESAANGYTATYNGCSNIELLSGAQATCTITNDDSDVSVNQPDLSIERIKPIQVVEGVDINDDGRIDLVKGKPTVIRIFPELDNPDLVENDRSITVTLIFEGHTLSSTITSIELKDLAFADASIDFYAVPQNASDSAIVGTIDYGNSVSEENESNNSLQIEISVKETNFLRIPYFEIPDCATPFGVGRCYGNGPNVEKARSTVENSNEFIKATFPVAPDRYVSELMGQFNGSPIPGLVGILYDVIDVQTLSKLVDPNSDRGVAIVPYNYFQYHRLNISGITWPHLGAIVEEGHWTTTAHELGHTLGSLWLSPFPGEEYDANPPGNIARGFWVEEKKPIENATCFMGLAYDFETFEDNWIDNGDYESLFKKFLVNESDPEILLISGVVSKDDSIELRNWYRLPEGTIDQSVVGDYTVQLLNASGGIVDEFPFDVSFVASARGSDALELDASGFVLAIPYHEKIVSLKILRSGKLIIEKDVTTKLLRDAINSIPTSGLDKNGEQRRSTLLNKVDVVEKMIKAGDLNSAHDKIKFDIRDKLVKWLIDYKTSSPFELSKTSIIELVDSLIKHLDKSLP